MKRSEAFEDLTIIVEPFRMYPPLGKIWKAIQVQDLQAAYDAAKLALEDERIQSKNCAPIRTRLEWWIAEVAKK